MSLPLWSPPFLEPYCFFLFFFQVGGLRGISTVEPHGQAAVEISQRSAGLQRRRLQQASASPVVVPRYHMQRYVLRCHGGGEGESARARVYVYCIRFSFGLFGFFFFALLSLTTYRPDDRISPALLSLFPVPVQMVEKFSWVGGFRARCMAGNGRCRFLASHDRNRNTHVCTYARTHNGNAGEGDLSITNTPRLLFVIQSLRLRLLPLLHAHSYYPRWLMGYDRLGRPILATRYGSLRLWEMTKLTTLERMADLHAREQELLLRVLRRRTLEGGGGGGMNGDGSMGSEGRHIVDTAVIVVDTAGLTLRHVSGVGQPVSATRLCTTCLSQNGV